MVLATAYTLVKKVQQLLFFCVVGIKALKIKILLKLKNIGETTGVEMMPKSTSYHEKLIQDLKNPLEAAAYIEVVLEEGDPKMLSKALQNVIESHGGVDQLSTPVKELYNKLDQMLSDKGEIEFYSLNSLLDALGLHLAVTVKS
jgi:DNA-binding phage protein